ncbi:uncharacterized protein [Rhodnius prolixus]|uniref:uncharacterized protein n=1 Tax=Rhodnius prolixus TaxID=13249 RepID=UPI003D1891F3
MSSEHATKTVRLTVDLSSCSKNGCAIFNYKHLLASAIKNKNNDDDEEEDGFEPKKFRRSFAELGTGYDDSDSFIDNTELEESVPEEIVTEFYVNNKRLKGHKK